MDFVTLFNRTDGQDTAKIDGEVSHIGPKGKLTIEKDRVDMGSLGPGIVVYPVAPAAPAPAPLTDPQT